MAGALLAILVRSNNFVPARLVRRAWMGFAVAVPLALCIEAFHARWIGFSFIALASVSFVYLALFATQKWVRALLTNRALVYAGTISYGIYLLEKIPADAAKSLHLDRYPLLALPVATLATFVLAALSWNFLEKPFLRLKRFFQDSPKSVVVPIAATVPGSSAVQDLRRGA